MHYFQWNIKTYRADTTHLSDAEDLAYRRLIEHYYDTESPIDANALQSLCRRLRLALPVVESILSEFFQQSEKGWIHTFIDAEIAKFHSKSASAKASADARWMQTHSERNAEAKPSQSEGNANQEPITNNHKPRINNKTKPISATGVAGYPRAFLDFWELYPNRKNKKAALKAFLKIPQSAYPEVKAGLLCAISSADWKKDDGEFIPHPARWLNAGGWESEYRTAEAVESKKQKPWFIASWAAIVEMGTKKGIVETRDLFGPDLKAAIFRAYAISPAMIRDAQIDWNEK
jgi:uncharacterized protein YdaU (DUF1376 family)